MEKEGDDVPSLETSESLNPLKNLWTEYRTTGSPEIKERLLAHYAPLVRHIVGKMKVALIPSLDIDDLESVGAIGLIKALERFDPDRYVKFETYAFRWVRGSVLDYVRQLDPLSRTSRERVTKLKRAFVELQGKLGRNPNEEELGDFLGWDPGEMGRLLFEMGSGNPLPLEGMRTDDETGEEHPMDIIRDEKDLNALDLLERQEMMNRLKNCIDDLPEKERLVVSLYYYDDLNFKEIGTILGVSESRVCQLHGRAVLFIQTELDKAA